MPRSNRLKLAWCVGAPFVLALGLELAARAFDLAPPRASPIRVLDQPLAEQLFRDEGRHRFDPRWMWEPRPGEPIVDDRINERAFRGPLPPREPRPALRIVALGESATFGMYLPEHAAWPRVLESKLRERGIDAQVLNYGVIAHTIAQGVERYCADARDWQPDVVLCCYGGRNEVGAATDGLSDPEKIALFDSTAMRARLWLDRSHAVRWINALLAGEKRTPAVAQPAAEPPSRVSIADYAALVERLRQATEHDGAKLMLVLPAFTAACEAHAPQVVEYQRAIAGVAREHSIRVADVRSVMRALDPPDAANAEPGPLFVDEAHPSESGSAIFADTILRALDEAQWLPPGAPAK